MIQKKICLMGMMVLATAFILTACSNDKKDDSVTSNITTAATDGNVEKKTEEEKISAVEPASASDFEYEVEDGKIVLKSYTGSATEIVIPATIDGKDVAVIGKQCFANQSSITRVVCPETLIEIREEAFINCTDLSDVALNVGIQLIGEKAFLTCRSLQTIDFPETLVGIGNLAFGLSGLTEITIPASLNELSEGCFCATNITTVTVPSNIKVLYKGAFTDCAKLEKAVLEEGLEKIEKDVFRGCTSLKEVNIPQSVNEMSDSVFWQANDVVVTVFPGSVAEESVKSEGVKYVNP